MSPITPYLMIAFYLFAAYFLIFIYRKENKCFLYIGAAFAVLGIWDILKLTVLKTLSSGFYPWIPKIICLVILLYACFVYITERRKTNENNKTDPRALEIPEDFGNSDEKTEENSEENTKE